MKYFFVQSKLLGSNLLLNQLSVFSFCPKIVFATIVSVETFVEEHYEEQLKYLRAQSNPNQELIDLLQSCQDDEIDHKLESAEKKNLTPGIFINIWTKIVGSGSAFAVKVAKII